MEAATVERGAFSLINDLEEAGAITPTSLDLAHDLLTFERYEALGVMLGRFASASKWWIGDYLVFGEDAYGELAAQAAEALNLSEDGRAECQRVALSVPRSLRRPGLSWWHHRLVAAKWITHEQRQHLLDRAELERLTTRELEALVRDLRQLDSDSRGATAEQSANPVTVLEAARSLVRAARCASDENMCLVPREMLQTLRVLLGEDA